MRIVRNIKEYFLGKNKKKKKIIINLPLQKILPTMRSINIIHVKHVLSNIIRHVFSLTRLIMTKITLCKIVRNVSLASTLLLSRGIAFPIRLIVRPANTQIRLRMRTV